jgi:hypothetical protein
MKVNYTIADNNISIDVKSLTEDFQNNWFDYIDQDPISFLQEFCAYLPSDAKILFWITKSGACEFSLILSYMDKSFAVMDLLFNLQEKTMYIDNLRVAPIMIGHRVGGYLLGLQMILTLTFDIESVSLFATEMGIYIFPKSDAVPSSDEWNELRQRLKEEIPTLLGNSKLNSYWD